MPPLKRGGSLEKEYQVYLAELMKNKKQVGTVSSLGIFTIELFSFPNKFGCMTLVVVLTFVSQNRVLEEQESCNKELYICTNGIYEIDMSNFVPNVNSMHNASNKRVKHNLDSTYLWHCYLAHISKKRNKKLQDDGLLKSTDDESFDQCVSCLLAKMTRKLFPHRLERVTDRLGLIHTDVCGPPRHVSRQERLLRHFNQIEEANNSLLIHTTQHNEVSERRNCTLLDMVRSMINLITLPLSFWDYALESAARILNMVLTKMVDKTPYELWCGKVPNLSYLKVWGCEALIKWDMPNKLQQRSVTCIFIGYPKETIGYYFYFLPENKIVFARYVKFFEKNLLSQKVTGRAGELKEIQDEDTSHSGITSEIPMEVKGFKPPHDEEANMHRPVRAHQAPKRLCLKVVEHSLGDLNEPTNYKDEMLDLESNKWLDAMNAEMQFIKDDQVLCLVDLSPNCKIVGSKWLFMKKIDMDGIVHTYKARLVAKGYTQLYRDVKIAFLNGYLDEDIYMVQPKGFVDPKHPGKMVVSETTNNNSIRSILDKEKSNGSNFLDWYRKLRIVLRNEQKLHHLEEALPEAPSATATAVVRNAYTCRVAEQQEVACLMLFVQNYNMHVMRKTIPELHAMLKLAEKGIPKKTLVVLAIRQGQIQKPKSQAKGKGKQRGKGKSKLAYDPKYKISLPAKKEHPAKDTECHHYHKTRHWKMNYPLYLAELKKNKANASGTSSIFTIELFSFPKRALDLYVGNGNTATVEAIGSFDLILPSGLILVLDNCHFSPSITRGVISLSHLWDNGFRHKFMDNGAISVSKDNICYFNAFPRYPLESAARILNMVPAKKTRLIKQEASGSTVDFDEIQSEDVQPSKNTSLHQHKVEHDTVEPQTDVIPICGSARIPYAPKRHGFYTDDGEHEIPHAPERHGFYIDDGEHELGDHREPPYYQAALSDLESEKWLEAMNVKMQSMKDNQVWSLVDLPHNSKGFTQTYRVDYEETFSPITDIKAIKILIAIAVYYDYEIWQMDVKTDFLNDRLNKDVYIVQPEGFVNPKHPRRVCKLQRSIYKLKQASMSWNKRFDEEIKNPWSDDPLTLDSAKSYVMQGASCAQRKVSMVPFVLSKPFVLSRGGSIIIDSFLPSILLLVVIIVTVVIVAVILVVVVVAIIGVIVVVVIVGVVVVNLLKKKEILRINIGDSGNTKYGGKIVGGAIGACGGIIATYACMTCIYGSSWKGQMASEAKRYLDKSSEGSREVFPDEA
nr:hypothetical protein [Tanacetum cinerariifolium]